MAEQSECIFCRIGRGEIPADVVFQNDAIVAFRDIQPAAPVHILVIPREHVASLHELGAEHQGLAGALLLAAQQVAEDAGIADAGYRVLTNVGQHGGQTVAHLHFHVLGGRQLGTLV